MLQSADFVTEAVHRVPGDTAPVALVCAADSDAQAIAIAIALARPAARSAVLVSVKGQQTNALLEPAGPFDKVHLVPAAMKALSREFLQQSGIELMARVRHADYVAQERARGLTVTENPSLVAWEALPESLRASNRLFAQAIGDIIGDLGGVLVPLRGVQTYEPLLSPGPLLERLAINEHDRWMSALRSEGWT